LFVKEIGRKVEANSGYFQSSSKNLSRFEGFVAVYDKEESKRANKIIDIAEEIIKALPFSKENKEYEKPIHPIYTYNIINYAI